MKLFGLIGKNIDYSFSRTYFSKKFEQEKLNCVYKNFDLQSIDKFLSIFETNTISGLNVTIPYKEVIIPFLDELDEEAKAIGAVNTVKIENDKLIGYNTDHHGFSKSIQPHLNKTHKRALILGTGGASKAIAYALECLGIEFRFVSRKNHNKEIYKYEDLHTQDIKEHTIIINSTPLGTYPNTEDCPNIPYGELSENHLVYDLIYNPMETKFLKYGKKAGAKTINGLEMLHLQAEKSWEIWHL